MKSIAFQSIASSIIASLLTLLFTLYSSNLYSVNDFGDYRYVFSILPIIMIFGLPGFDRVILRAGFNKKRINLIEVLLTRFISISIFIFILFVLIEMKMLNLSESLYHFLPILFLIPIFELFSGYKNYLISHDFSGSASYHFFISRSLSLVLSIIGLLIVYYNELSISFVLICYFVAMTIPQILMFAIVINYKAHIIHFRNQKGFKWLKEGVYTTLSSSASTFAFNADKLFLYHYFGASELALYSILVMIPQELARITDALIPYFYKNIVDKNISALKIKISLIFLTFIVIYSPLFYFISPLIFGESYVYSIFQTLTASLLGIVLIIEFFYTQRIYLSLGASKLSIIAICNGIATCIFLLILGPLYGILGFLMAIIIKSSVVCLLSFIIMKNNNVIKSGDLW